MESTSASDAFRQLQEELSNSPNAPESLARVLAYHSRHGLTAEQVSELRRALPGVQLISSVIGNLE